jgi:NAD-dependent SIR2 family protein deacetylase
MVDVSAIAGTVSALKGAMDITKAMIGLHDAQAVQAKVIELNAKILEAQSSAFTANDERAALIDRVRQLENEVARLRAWEAEKQQYQFAEVSQGVYAYTPKEGAEAAKVFHMLCANCFQQNEPSVLQATQELRARRRVHKCPRCLAEYEMEHVPRPAPPQVNTRYNPLNRR